MSSNTFPKGDPTSFHTSTRLKKFENFSSFAAPKRMPLKPNSSIQNVPKRFSDENERPISQPSSKLPAKSKSGKNEYSQTSEARVLNDFQSSIEEKVSMSRSQIIGKYQGSSNLARIREKVERLKKDFIENLYSSEKFNEFQVKYITQATNNIIGLIVEEIERLDEILLDKIQDNEDYKLNALSLERRIKELEQKDSSYRLLSQDFTKGSFNGIADFDNKFKSFTLETLNTEEDFKEIFHESNKTYTPQTKLLSTAKTNLSNIGSNGNGIDKTLGRKISWEDRMKIEELTTSLSALNSSLNEKIEENKTLCQEIEQLKKNSETTAQQLLRQQQVTEKLRTELMNSHAQNQELNQKLSIYKANNKSPPLKDVKTVDSPKASFETNEWQKKYEIAKSDNERLIRIVEENHKVIQNFKQIFSDLANRNNKYSDAREADNYRRDSTIRANENPIMPRTHGKADRVNSFCVSSSSSNLIPMG